MNAKRRLPALAGLSYVLLVAIEGLGDIAVDANFGSILVVSGDTLFDLQAFGWGERHGVELARKVIANLG